MATTYQSLLVKPQTTETSKSIITLYCLVLPLICFLGTVGLFFYPISNLSSNSLHQDDGLGKLYTYLQDTVPPIENVTKKAVEYELQVSDPKEHGIIDICVHLLEMSKYRIALSLESIDEDGLKSKSSYNDVHTWLSAVLTNHFTCLDELEDSSSMAKSLMEGELNELVARAREALAMLVSLPPNELSVGTHDNFLKPLGKNLPAWFTSKERKLLEARPKDLVPDLVVAQDGSGDYQTVGEAVAAVPNRSETRYVIYVKSGTYIETVRIISAKRNIMLVGDGMDSTIITGSLNGANGTGTFQTATVAADGDGFIGQDIWFQNTAGPEGHQAVALRVSADKSVINRCRMDAYQDTLYPHSLRQFYRDSEIMGTIDFIFGDAAVVLQNCTIIARKPMDRQKNMVTAQGRLDPNENTGTSIQMCNIIPSEDLKPVQSSFRSYLGRPWKTYSRTVIMQSYIEDHIHPEGWHQWDEDTDFEALYYGEYSNIGLGANTVDRVDWPGFHVITNPAEAVDFTVAELIQGGDWLGSTGVNYTAGL